MNTTIVKLRAAARPDFGARDTANDLVTLFALDRLPARRPRLVAHWHRRPDGRLACAWEPDLSAPRRRAD
jgi:hypothetical protein